MRGKKIGKIYKFYDHEWYTYLVIDYNIDSKNYTILYATNEVSWEISSNAIRRDRLI